jgi:hypothetical protein
MSARGSLIAGGLVLFLALAGGAAFITGIVHLPRNCEGPSPNWDKPGGVQVADLKEAAPYLSFTPVAPRGLGPASKLLVGGTKPDLSAKTLLWVYEQPVYGRFWVRESIAEVDQAWIDSRRNNPTGCSEDSVVTLQSGTKAALSVGRWTSIMWLDVGLLIDVLGTFSKGQALEVANRV